MRSPEPIFLVTYNNQNQFQKIIGKIEGKKIHDKNIPVI